jgi:hypothetical protein
MWYVVSSSNTSGPALLPAFTHQVSARQAVVRELLDKLCERLLGRILRVPAWHRRLDVLDGVQGGINKACVVSRPP